MERSQDSSGPWATRWRRLPAAAFLLTVLLPPLAGLVGFEGGPRLVEKRQKAQAPSRPETWEQLDSYPERFDAYYKDHFGLRDPLILGHHWTWRKIFRVSPVPKAVLGKKGWLFLGPPATDYQAQRPMDEQDLAAWRNALLGYQDRLSALGIPFVFAVAPNKHTVYPEYLPPSAKALWRTSPLDQLLEDLRRNTDIHVVDLRPAILAAKAEGKRVYFRNDTHWTPDGDYAAYRGLVEGLRDTVGLDQAIRERGGDQAFEPLPRSAFTESDGLRNGGDLSRLMGIRFVPESYRDLTLTEPQASQRFRGPKKKGVRRQFHNGKWQDVFENPTRELRAIMLIDSFGLQLETHMAEHFRRIVYRPGVLLPDAVLRQEKPDLVIMEMVERYIAEPIQLRYLTLGQMRIRPQIFAGGFETGGMEDWDKRSHTGEVKEELRSQGRGKALRKGKKAAQQRGQRDRPTKREKKRKKNRESQDKEATRP